MVGVKKLSPLEAFTDNINDAKELLDLAEALTNVRRRRMRRELREKVGQALRLNQGDWDELDCVESDDVFIVLKPETEFTREAFQHQRAMLRQSVVAAATAFETYVGDKATEQVRRVIGRANRTDPLPAALAKLRLRIDTWDKVNRYDRRRRAITDHFIAPEISTRASTHPERVKELLKMTDLEDPLGLVDAVRGVPGGTTHSELLKLNQRRNRIAHSGDRVGRGKARVAPVDVRQHVDAVESIVNAVESLY